MMEEQAGLIGLAFYSLLALGMSTECSLPFWPCLLIIVVAGVANGVLAEWEDWQPGGFCNPDGEILPRVIS
jgi:hypothetical protein